jgi:cold shock CspA family protein/ribosomal protein L37AE/L43A
MLIGLVKWFDADKGFGVVGTPNGEEYFLHINSFTSKPEKIFKGTPITFSPKTDKAKSRNSANNSRLVGIAEDWKTILSYLGKSDAVRIEVEITGRNRFGNKYHRKETQSFSLLGISLKFFFNDKNEEAISNFIIDYFDNDLDPKLFISYCELIEDRLTKHFSSDISSNILDRVFSHFGKNMNEELFFNVWKQKNFKYISYNEMDDYEISENILKAYIKEIGKAELNRILKFSFGPEFCSYYVNNKFSNLDILTSMEIKELYQFIEFEAETEREKRKHQMDILYVQKIETELTEKANELDTIVNNDDFNNYNRLLQLITSELDDIHKVKITEEIHQIIVKKSSDEYKAELWVKGIIKDISFEFIKKLFFDEDTQSDKRISILAKLETDQQFELLKTYSDEYNTEIAFELLEGLLKRINSLDYLEFLDVLFDDEFWKDKKGNELLTLFNNYIDAQSLDEQKYELFMKGYVKNVPLNIVRQNLHRLEKEGCNKIFKSISENELFIRDILTEKLKLENTDSLSWLYDLAIEYLDPDNYNSFDEYTNNSIEESEYFKLWEKGKAKIFPQKHISEFLLDKYENYAQIKKWIESKATTIDKVSDFLISYILRNELVTDRIVFYKQMNYIKYLLLLDDSYLDKIKQIKSDFYNLILWVIEKDNFFDFELLKQKFIYFAPDDQVRIIKKLFLLKAKGQFDLTIEKLNELTRFDLDLYKINLEYNPELLIDISTDLVIKVLLSYQQNKRFFVESELLKVILDDLKPDKTRRFKLSNYFEKCLGRETAKFDWSREGEISKMNFGINEFYYAISFSTGETKWVNDRRGGREVYSSNLNFENLKEAVKKIPGVKWEPNKKHWCVPSQYETEVLKFAGEHRFFLNLEGSNYSNNIHLAEFKREEIPNGILFCEGRLANKPHEMFKKEFWWCGGQPCFSKCETIHKADEWEKYTLLDFCEILGLNTDEINKMGDYIPKGHYYQFISLINRFNRLLEKLYCQECNHILYPSDFGIGHFAAHSVVRFQCRNEACSTNDEIYLNHCLNGQCNCIIDSRVSRQCDNGLFICNNCGSCCSHKMLERRLSNLKLTGGYVHDNLVKSVNEKLGHLERGEYFCYKCKSEMMEISSDIYECSNCSVKYDTTTYTYKKKENKNRE